jgi:glyoxylase I family protein
MNIQKLYHVAYRCNNAQETTDFYTNILGLKFSMAMSQERVPSTQEEIPYIHIFFEMADGSNVAFFELPTADASIPDSNTPAWVQHLALEVSTLDELNEFRDRLTENGIDFIGPVDHGTINSVYFFDPNGHRLEVAVRVSEKIRAERAARRFDVLEAWNKKWHAGDAAAGS